MKLGERHPAYGKCAAVGSLSGERYYWFVDRYGAVAMMPACAIDQEREPCPAGCDNGRKRDTPVPSGQRQD